MKTAQTLFNNLILGDNQFRLKHTKSFNIPISIGFITFTHMLNGYEICLNTKIGPIFNMQDFRYQLCTSIVDCFGQMVLPLCLKCRSHLILPQPLISANLSVDRMIAITCQPIKIYQDCQSTALYLFKAVNLLPSTYSRLPFCCPLLIQGCQSTALYILKAVNLPPSTYSRLPFCCPLHIQGCQSTALYLFKATILLPSTYSRMSICCPLLIQGCHSAALYLFKAANLLPST